MPKKPKSIKKYDFNDVVLREGIKAVSQTLDQAISYHDWVEKTNKVEQVNIQIALEFDQKETKNILNSINKSIDQIEGSNTKNFEKIIDNQYANEQAKIENSIDSEQIKSSKKEQESSKNIDSQKVKTPPKIDRELADMEREI